MHFPPVRGSLYECFVLSSSVGSTCRYQLYDMSVWCEVSVGTRCAGAAEWYIQWLDGVFRGPVRYFFLRRWHHGAPQEKNWSLCGSVWWLWNFFNSLLTLYFVQLFSGNSSVNFFAVYPFKYKLLIKILCSSLHTMLIVDKRCSDVCCDEFSVPQTDRKSTKVKEQWHGKFYLQSVWGKTCYFNHRIYHNLWMNNKVRDD